MGLGQALQNIGGMYLQRNWQKQDAKKAEDQRKLQQAEDQKIWEARQQYLARLQAPQERVRQVYDEQLQAAVNIRETYQPPTGDMSQGPPVAGRWVEEGRDRVAPKAGELKTFRQGDEEVTAMIDPTTGEITREIGRGSAFSPSQRRTAGAGGSNVGGGGIEGAGGERTAPGRAPADPAGKAEATRQQEEAKALGQNAKNIIEKAQGARETLAIVGEMEKLMSGGLSTGPVDQYLPGKDRQRFDVLQKQLVGPVIKSMFGSTQLSEGDRKAAEASLPGLGRYEDVNKDVLAQMRRRAEAAIAEEAALKQQQGGQAPVAAKKSPYPEGTRLRGPDGVYEVRNGEAVKVQ